MAGPSTASRSCCGGRIRREPCRIIRVVHEHSSARSSARRPQRTRNLAPRDVRLRGMRSTELASSLATDLRAASAHAGPRTQSATASVLDAMSTVLRLGAGGALQPPARVGDLLRRAPRRRGHPRAQLATCSRRATTRSGAANRAASILQGASSSELRYLLATSQIKCQKLGARAQAAEHGTTSRSTPEADVPNGAAGLYLDGRASA